MSVPEFQPVFRTNAVQHLRLVPGRYIFGTLYGPTFRFDVDSAGNIGYDAALTFLCRPCTPMLAVVGLLMSVDATRLGTPSFNINDSASGLGRLGSGRLNGVVKF